VEEVFSYPTTNPHEVYRPYEYPTTSVTLLKFANGRTLGKCASLTDAMQPYVFNMNFVGSHGAVKNDLFYSKKIRGLLGWTKMDVQLVDSGDVAHHPYKEQFSDFAACLESGAETRLEHRKRLRDPSGRVRGGQVGGHGQAGAPERVHPLRGGRAERLFIRP